MNQLQPFTQSELQKYWDACLIRVWRNAGTTCDALIMFRSITGVEATECEILRTPKSGVYFAKQMRVFVANQLPRIGAWLFKVGTESDALLLKKLSVSNYTTSGIASGLPDEEKKALYRENSKNRAAREYTTREISGRNSSTDWGTVKTPHARARRAA